MNRRVSILINNYNYGRFLGQAIDSALNQTYPHCEVVVVDDGSTDESRDVIRSYGTRICPVLKENGGQGSAYNAGFSRATGDIIMLLDSDDYLKPAAAERVVAAWNTQTDILHHRLEIVDATGKLLGRWPAAKFALDSGDMVPNLLHKGIYSAPPSSGLVYSRRILEKLLPVDEKAFRIGADSWLLYQAPFLAPVHALDEGLVCYRVHGGNAAGVAWPNKSSTRKHLEGFVNLLEVKGRLIAKQAKARGVMVNTLAWEDSITLRWRLILMRLGSLPSTWGTRGAMVSHILKKIGSERHSLSGGLKDRLLALTIWLAPRFVLRRIYPNMFS